MSKKILTEAEVMQLKGNEYVKSVTERCVILTTEFKILAYERIQKGERLRDVLDSIGIDSDVLGEARLHGIQGKLYKVARQPGGFASIGRKKQERVEKTKAQSLEAQVKKLERKLLEAEQIIDFLKKTQQIDLEAEKEQRRKRGKSSP